MLAPTTVAQMGQPRASRFGQPIWGLGTMLYADDRAGGFVVGPDANTAPATNTAARLHPATGHAIVILETGQPLLATRLANEWVFRETGRVDFLAFKLAMPGMLGRIGWGSLAIAVLVPSAAHGTSFPRQARFCMSLLRLSAGVFGASEPTSGSLHKDAPSCKQAFDWP